jgi:polyhydroxyalkanoate synthesis regulator phasin
VGEIIKAESKLFMDELGEEFKEAKKQFLEKDEEPRIHEIEMQDFLGDPDDIQSENTIYFDQSKKLLFNYDVDEVVLNNSIK